MKKLKSADEFDSITEENNVRAKATGEEHLEQTLHLLQSLLLKLIPGGEVPSLH